MTQAILETLESVFVILKFKSPCLETYSQCTSWSVHLPRRPSGVHFKLGSCFGILCSIDTCFQTLQDDSNLVAEAAESISRLFANTHPGTLRSVSRSLETLSECPVPVPTVLESTHALSRVLRSYGSLLRPTFSHAWKFGLTCVGSLIGNLFRLNKNAEHLVPHVRTLILELDDIVRDAMSQSDPELAKICERSLSLVLSALGVSEFLNIVTFHKRTTDLVWFRSSALGSWHFFLNTFLTVRVICTTFEPRFLPWHAHGQKIQESKFTENERKHERAQCIRLWSLFPCFCVRGSDAAETYPRLARTLATVLQDANYPELVPVICRGIVTLIGRVPESSSLREAMSKFSKNMMPVFFNMIDRHHGVWDELKVPNGGIGVGEKT